MIQSPPGSTRTIRSPQYSMECCQPLYNCQKTFPGPTAPTVVKEEGHPPLPPSSAAPMRDWAGACVRDCPPRAVCRRHLLPAQSDLQRPDAAVRAVGQPPARLRSQWDDPSVGLPEGRIRGGHLRVPPGPLHRAERGGEHQVLGRREGRGTHASLWQRVGQCCTVGPSAEGHDVAFLCLLFCNASPLPPPPPPVQKPHIFPPSVDKHEEVVEESSEPKHSEVSTAVRTDARTDPPPEP